MSLLHIKKQRGFTIVEAIISLGLGMLLTAALVQVFSSSNKISDVEGALSRLQETGRFALNTMINDVRMAGFSGCVDPQPDIEDTNVYPVWYVANQLQGSVFTNTPLATGMIGYEVDNAGNLQPAANVAAPFNGFQPRPGTDVISINYASRQNVEVTGNPGGGDILINNNDLAIAAGDLLLVSDCFKGHIFETTGVTAGPVAVQHTAAVNSYPDMDNDGLADTSFSPEYGAGSRLYSWTNRTYFIGDTGRTTENGSVIWGLFQSVRGNPPQELLEGVENLQIEYGQQVRNSNGMIRYVDADDPTLEYGYIVSVRIGLLVQSFDQVTDTPDNINYPLPGGVIVVPGNGTDVDTHARDRSLRKPFVATIKLRNRRNLDIDI